MSRYTPEELAQAREEKLIDDLHGKDTTIEMLVDSLRTSRILLFKWESGQTKPANFQELLYNIDSVLEQFEKVADDMTDDLPF